MSQPKLSIVIPVYHSEKYLPECLDSILCQDFPDYEVICVDDGSTDGSLEVLKGYAMRDPRFRVMSQSHGGPGVARNLGMAEAEREYLYFMDSDDFLSGKDVFSLMVEEMETQGLDLLFFGMEVFFENDVLEKERYREMQRYRGGKSYGTFDYGAELFCAMVRNGDFVCNAVSQCARRSFLQEIHASFPLRDFYEDEVYTFQNLLRAGRSRHIDWKPYMRRVREGSVTTRPHGFLEVWEGILGWRDMMDFLAEGGTGEAARDAAIQHMARRGQDLARKFYALPVEERDKQHSLSESDRSYLHAVLGMEPVFRRQMASYLFPYHLFRRGERVVIYGAGNVGREFYLQAMGSGYVECAGILDRQAHARRTEELPVCLPGALRDMAYDAVLIAAQDRTLAESIRKDLRELGVADEKIAWDGAHYLKQDFCRGYYFPLLDRLHGKGK